MKQFPHVAAGAVLAALVAAATLVACTPSWSAPPRRAEQAAKPSSNDAPQNLGLQGQHSLFTMPDKSHPQWVLWKLSLENLVGMMTSNSVKGHGATAVLFSKGRRSEVMTSPTATGNFQTETVFATDGVHLVSVAPPGRFLNANSVIWNAKTQLGKAFGNVRYGDTKSGWTGTSPVIYFNSSLEEFSTSPLRGSAH